MAKALYDTIQDELGELKKARNAIILAHNYQLGEVQDAADFLGDSLGLALKARESNAETIVFCGVIFMAETVSVLCPDKTVLVPDLEAGCSLASMIRPEQVHAWKAEHPNGVVLGYVNTTAAVKAECDYCCTSANAEKILAAIPREKEVLFIPDYFLGKYLELKSGRKLHLWQGFCHAHVKIKAEEIDVLRREHPDAEFLMHPECGCLTKSMAYADQILSTEGIVRHVDQSTRREFIIATEVGILDRLQKKHPEKIFYPAGRQAVCEYMKRNTLEKIVTSLERLEYVIRIPEETARAARIPLERMLAVK